MPEPGMGGNNDHATSGGGSRSGSSGGPGSSRVPRTEDDLKRKKKGLGPFDELLDEGLEDSGTTFAGETEEEARLRREAGGKSKRPEEIRVQQGGMLGSQTAGVQTEGNGKQTRGGLAI